MKTSRDVAELIGFSSGSDVLTEAIVGLLVDDAEVRQAAADYIEAHTLYWEGDGAPAAVHDAERRLRRVIAPKIRGALVTHGREWELPDDADYLSNRFVEHGAFVEFYVDA